MYAHILKFPEHSPDLRLDPDQERVGESPGRWYTTIPTAGQSPAQTPAAGGRRGAASPCGFSPPDRARHSRDFAREPPASDTPAIRRLIDVGGSTGGSRPPTPTVITVPRLSRRPRLPFSLGREWRAALRTRPRGRSAAERNTSPADRPGDPDSSRRYSRRRFLSSSSSASSPIAITHASQWQARSQGFPYTAYRLPDFTSRTMP